MTGGSPQRIPIASPRAAYFARREQIDGAIARVLERGIYILGEETEAFEEEFAAFIGVKFAIGVASGTDALELAIRAAGINAGDAVITTSNTAVATVAAIERAGATVLLADVDDRTYTIDPAHVEKLLADDRERRIRGIVPVHLYGQPAAMGELMRLADAHGLIVVEDCAQAHGATVGGMRVGSFGRASAFSFYPTKNLGAIGDGGMVVTNDAKVAERTRAFRQYGWRTRYVSETRGWNSRLDEIQAAILRVKLPHLDEENRRRRAIAAAYTAAAAGGDLVTPVELDGHTHVYHQYVARVCERDSFRSFLDARGIETTVLYPVPIHSQPAYRGLATSALPVTERIAGEIVSLPMYPTLTDEEVARVCAAVTEYSRVRGSR